jgi:adenine deaminase
VSCSEGVSRRSCCSTLFFVPRAVAAEPEPAAPRPVVYVKAGHLFDATGDDVRDNIVLVIEGEHIARIEPAAQVAIPAGAEVIDLSHAWVLPGLIDCHTIFPSGRINTIPSTR